MPAIVTGYVTGKHSRMSTNATHATATTFTSVPHGSGMAKYRGGRTFVRPRQSTMACGMTTEVWQKMMQALIMDEKTFADPMKIRP